MKKRGDVAFAGIDPHAAVVADTGRRKNAMELTQEGGPPQLGSANILPHQASPSCAGGKKNARAVVTLCPHYHVRRIEDPTEEG
jgi:hypothetical protein